MKQKILVVEDDIQLSRTIQQLLQDNDYEVILSHTAEDGLEQAQANSPDLVLLDVMVPHMGGWQLCGRLRKFTAVPIIFLTALSNTADIVKGLQLGADDYITKPFEHAEFLARVSAHLRRHVGPVSDRLSFDEGALQIDLSNYMVMVNGEEMELTPREFSLLAVLAKNAGRVVATEDLLEEAWGEAYANAKQNIKPYIHYLRKKIEQDPAAPRWIKTVRGVGYRFNIEDS